MKCETCGKEIINFYGSGRFCSEKCAKKFATKNINKNQVKFAKCSICGKDITIKINASSKTCKCDICKYKQLHKITNSSNDINFNCSLFTIPCTECYFKKNGLCIAKSSMVYKLNTLHKYCNFDLSCKNNYELILKEYLSLKYKIQYLIDKGFSCVDICTNIFGGSKKGNTVFNILQIKCKTLSESVSNAYIHGKMNDKIIEHITWNNKKVILRSSYEEKYANYLDSLKIEYLVEYLYIDYYDTQLCRQRIAIPDFYIPSQNLIVEIKSSWTYNKQNMLDKKNAYLNKGYQFKLILDHKEMEI